MSAPPPLQEKPLKPGDDLIPHADVVSDTSFIVNAPQEEVYGYIAQMGMRKSHGESRGGWPLPASIETFIPKDRRALREVDPSLALKAGDNMGDWFSGRTKVDAEVVEAEAPYSLVFLSKRGKKQERDVSWALVTEAQEDGTTRVSTRLKVNPVKHEKVIKAVGGIIDRALVAGLRAGINERVAGKPEASEKGYKALKVGAIVGTIAIAYAIGRKGRR